MGAVRSELTAQEMTDLRAKLSILETAIKLKIAGFFFSEHRRHL